MSWHRARWRMGQLFEPSPGGTAQLVVGVLALLAALSVLVLLVH